MKVEEVLTFAKENPEFSNGLLSGFSETHVIRTKENESEWQKNFISGLNENDQRVKHIVDSIVKRERTSFEEVIKKHTGKDKKPLDTGGFEDAVTYANSALSESITELNERAKKGITNEEAAQKLTALEKTRAAEQKEHQEAIKKLQEDNRTGLLEKSFSAKISSLTLSDDVDRDLLGAYDGTVKSEFMKMNPQVKEKDGKEIIVLHDESGSEKYDSAGNLLTADSFINSKYSKYLKEPRVILGAGLKPKDPKTQTGDFVLTADVKDKDTLRVKLETHHNAKSDDPKVVADYIKYSKDLPLQAK